jgi:RecB family endonuclease NucS
LQACLPTATVVSAFTAQQREALGFYVSTRIRTSAESKLHEGDIVKGSVRHVADDYGDAVRKDVEEHLARNPRLIGEGLELADRHLILGSDQIDLLFEDRIGNLTVVAVKSNAIGRDALQQTQRHVHELKGTGAGKTVKGVIVCTGVTPGYASELRKQKDVRILIYAWEMQVRQL